MNITALAIDSKMPNLAIEKIKAYHAQRGDTIYVDPIFVPQSDIAYVSVIFDWNKSKASEYLAYDNVMIGGSGWEVKAKLPKEIDAMCPKINIGFSSRGCNNKCSFCIVHEKEGSAYPECDVYDIWDGKSKHITLLDNNILQLPGHFELIAKQAIKEKIRIDFNQGLDHKLLNDDVCHYLKQIRHGHLRFAFDSPTYLKSAETAIKLLNKHGIKFSTWYVLVGFNTTLDDDFFRIEYLKANKQTPFVMKHKNCYGKPIYTDMARWCNQPMLMRKKTFNEFLQMHNMPKTTDQNNIFEFIDNFPQVF